ncbi:hypothetical protein ACH4UM_31705 [Streptomyces sp. NPDC020801]|uniref:hypothetical protein n=1 Tax=unclassified Streptomyces TaxID=2593676 RepID=UPI0037991FBC
MEFFSGSNQEITQNHGKTTAIKKDGGQEALAQQRNAGDGTARHLHLSYRSPTPRGTEWYESDEHGIWDVRRETGMGHW